MAYGYLPVDRDQLLLLPPSMREWLPEDHLAWFVVEVVERVNTAAFDVRHPNDGVGRRAYDPKMMLALLLYAYSQGVLSSRRIEQLCRSDLAYRVICAAHAPDHSAIARFRVDHEAAIKGVFVDILVLCAAAGLTSLGTIAVDGTKIAADAAMHANRSGEAIRAELGRLRAEVGQILAAASDTDRGEDDLFGAARGDELPAELASPLSRIRRLERALAELAELEAAAAERAATAEAEAEQGRRVKGRKPKDPRAALARAERDVRAARVHAEAARARWAQIEARAAARGHRPTGSPPSAAEAELVEAERNLEAARAAAEGSRDPTRANLTDPASRIMNSTRGWLQGYNAQAAVDANQVVIACDVTNHTADSTQWAPMTAATLANLAAAAVSEPVGVMLFDAGYWSETNATAPGPDRLIATLKGWKQRRAARTIGTTTGPPPPDATPHEAMEHRLRTPEGAALYSRRSCTVEPVFADHKHRNGFRRFSRRGLAAVQSEWALLNATYNLRKLWRNQPASLALS